MPSLRKSALLPSSEKRRFYLRRLTSSMGGGSFTSAVAVTTSDDNVFLDLSRNFPISDPTHALAADAANDAKKRFHELLPPSLLAEGVYHEHEQDCVPPFLWDECVLGPLLGSGEFSNVHDIKSFHFGSIEDNGLILTGEERDRKLLMKKCEKYRQTKKPRYVLKHIKPEHLETDQGRIAYVEATSDLALEKEFLSSLSHPHIIKLRGVANNGPTGVSLIIDRLVETLDQRIRSWRGSNPRRKPGLSRSMSSLSVSFTSKVKHEVKSDPKAAINEVLDARLSIAFQIAAAITYLHSHSIVYRDLKPTNIGFDVRGEVNIFDFGLARFCPKGGDPNNETFEMSGAGSPRYMAPECLSGNAYNMKADVYSFAIVLWEILAGKTPYIFIRGRHHLINYVVEENGRPDIDQCWPAAIQSTLESSFNAKIEKRPETKQVYKDIREVLLTLRGDESSSLDDSWVLRRRSVTSTVG